MANQSSLWMCCVIQTDFPNQMDVFRWLRDSDMYRIVYICHDRDIVDEEHERTDGDGQTTILKVGDTKPEHIHCIIKLPKRLSASTMTKRFGAYVNFQLCADPQEYALYLTHSTFDSRKKYHYSKSRVKGDLQLYNDLIRGQVTKDTLSCVNRYLSYVRDGLTRAQIVEELCDRGDTDLLQSVMGHAFFYSQFFDRRGGDDGRIGNALDYVW